MTAEELKRISIQIDVLKKNTYVILKALNHLSKEISEAQMVEEKTITESVIDMPEDHKLHIYFKNGQMFNAKLV